MKALTLLSLISLTIATDFQMNLRENSEDFVEDISVDVDGNTERIRVPQHQDREQVDILNDFNMELQALKIVKANMCYISSIDASEQRPDQMEKSLRVAHSQFPNDHYMVSNERFLPVRNMSSSEVGRRIAEHCRGSSLILVEKVTRENIQERALAAVNAVRSRQKRYTDIPFEYNMACSSDAASTIQSCFDMQSRPQCNVYRRSHSSCAYHVTCRRGTNNAGQVGIVCTGEHRYSLIFCCNFSCY